MTIATIPVGGAEPQADPRQQWSNIPAELLQRPQWALADDAKVPRTATGGWAKSTDPSTWADFDTVAKAASERGWGVGYMLHESDPFACVDLDLKNETTHPDKPDDWTTAEDLDRFESIKATLNSYTEHSRSGFGWHVWVKAAIGKGRKRDGVELYSQERFIICTGSVVRDQPIAERQNLVANMASQLAAETTIIELWGHPAPNFAVAEEALAGAGELGRLFRGEWEGRYASQSDADLALVKLLIPLSASPAECWGTFQLSVLGQRKKAKRPDYAQSTMSVAVAHVTADAEQLRHGAEVAALLLANMPLSVGHSIKSEPKGPLRLLFDDDLDALPPLRWLVKGVIPNAGIGAIYGDSGTYKSFLTLDCLAHVSTGREWFGCRVKGAPSVYVPFEGQGGIPNRVRAWRMAQTRFQNPNHLAIFEPDAAVRSGVAVIMEPLNLQEQSDRDRLVTGLKAQGWAGGILCIDTLAHAANGIDENGSAMGEMIGIFRDLQQQLGGVILLVHHSGKDPTRGMRGWSGLHAAMDFVVECKREGEDEGSRQAEFRLAKVKDGTTGTTHKFRMELVPLGFDEDGDAITSLVVRPVEETEHPFLVDEAQEAAVDEAFVDAWVRRLMAEGIKPTGKFLEGRRASVKAERDLTQKRLRNAIESLKGVGRLEETPGGPSNSRWLRAVDLP